LMLLGSFLSRNPVTSPHAMFGSAHIFFMTLIKLSMFFKPKTQAGLNCLWVFSKALLRLTRDQKFTDFQLSSWRIYLYPTPLRVRYLLMIKA